MGNTLPIIARNYGWVKKEIRKNILETDTAEEIAAKPGTYRMLLHMASYCFKTPKFYWKNLDFLLKYLADLGSIKPSEAKRVAQMVVLWGTDSEEEARSRLSAVLRVMRVRVDGHHGACLSPAVDQELYSYVTGDGFETLWSQSIWRPVPLFSFSTDDCENERERQLHEDRSDILDVEHGRNACLAAWSNKCYFNWMNNKTIRKIPIWKEKPKMPIKPRADKERKSSWDILQAHLFREWNMVYYLLYLLPELLASNIFWGNSFVHYVVAEQHRAWGHKSWEVVACLKELRKSGCDFEALNEEGWRPIEICAFPPAAKFLRQCGYGVHVWEDGESKMEIGTREWNLKIVEKQLELGADILEPNPAEGYFWMPWVIKNKYYGDLGFNEFQEMVRKKMRGNRKAPYYDNKVCTEIINRPIGECARNDAKDLLDAVKANDISRIKVLLALGAPTEWQNKKGETSLISCAEKGFTETATLLLQNFANPNRANKKGENCFRIACLHGHFDVATVCHRFGTDIDEVALDGLTMCHVAYNQGQEAMLKFCLDEGCDVNKPNSDGFSVQYLAIRDHKDELAEKLQSQYKGNFSTKDSNGNTLAYCVLQDRDVERLKYLVQRGIDLESKNNTGSTVFMEAVRNNDLEMCGILLSLGSDVNTMNGSGYTPLMEAYQHGNMQMVQFLLDKGCDTNIRAGNKDKQTALIMAVVKNDLEMCDKLLDHGANLEIGDVDGKTPILVCACADDSNYKKETFKYLISKGCSINRCDDIDCTLLGTLILKNRDDEARQVLQMEGAQVRFPDKADEPIVRALGRKDPYWFKELLKHGANAMNERESVVDLYLHTSYFSFDGLRQLGQFNLEPGCPLHTAISQGRRDVVMYLWKNAKDEDMRRSAATCFDSRGRNAVICALTYGFNEFAEILINRDYGCDSWDDERNSPILLAAKSGNLNWTSTLYDRYGVIEAGFTNHKGQSALTFAAENGWESMCDEWFIRDISVECETDSNGIISHYQELLREHEDAIDRTRSNYKSSKYQFKKNKAAYEQAEKRIWKSDRPSSYLKRDRDRFERQMLRAEDAMRHYGEALDAIVNIKRRQLLRGAGAMFENGCTTEYYDRIKGYRRSSSSDSW